MRFDQCIDNDTLQQLISQALPTDKIRHCEKHLDRCQRCQQQLQKAAGDPKWWGEAAELLSTRDVQLNPSANDVESTENQRARAATLTQLRQILQSPTHPEMLGRLGSYEIESFLGQGGFGVVFKAHDAELNRPVAIKVLSPHLASSGVARRRFAREAQAAAAVVHPNVVPIHAVQSEVEFPYLVMSYVPGSSLHTFVQQHGPMDAKPIVRIAAQVSAGLAAAHRQGLVHRDIKPANILLENELSRALITDFGLARAADDAAVSQTGWLAGTPHYMSPEQARGADLDGRSDLFSLGSVMYFMATGREPFRDRQPLLILQKICSTQPLPAHRINTDVPRALSKIIQRLHEKEPNRRIQTAQQLTELLEHYLAHLQQPQTMALPRLPISPGRWQQAVWAALLSMVLIAATIFVAIWTGRGEVNNAPDSISATQTQQQLDSQKLAAFAELQRELSQFESEGDLLWQELHEIESSFRAVELGIFSQSLDFSQTAVQDLIQAETSVTQEQLQRLERAMGSPSR